MKIISLIDNLALPEKPDLSSEPGLSMLIQAGGRRILFDTGLSGDFLLNAQKLNIDLAGVDLAVLSHHHFDHGGGLAAFFGANGTAPIYLRTSRTEELYRHLYGLFKKPIGLDAALLKQHAQRFKFVDRFTEIDPGVFILAEIGRRHPAPRGNRLLFVHTPQGARLDDFGHELILVVSDQDGLVVFSGCSHNGILNMLDAVVGQFPGQKIKAVFGGFHLFGTPPFRKISLSKTEVEALGRAILAYPVEKVFTCHCTGMAAYQVLKAVMGDQLDYFAAGSAAEV